MKLSILRSLNPLLLVGPMQLRPQFHDFVLAFGLLGSFGEELFPDISFSSFLRDPIIAMNSSKSMSPPQR